MDEKCVPVFRPSRMSENVIIFHPGSRHLYFGRAADSEPHCVLHIIARRRKSADSTTHQDTLIPAFNKNLSKEALCDIGSCRDQLLQVLENFLMTKTDSNNDGNFSKCKFDQTGTNQDDVVTTNASEKVSKPDICTPLFKLTPDLLHAPFIVGNDVLKIGPEEPYNIHCPWKRGQLNLHGGVGGSLSSVVTDLEDIWRWCIETKLGIPTEEFKNYRAVVIIPTMFDRVHAKEIADLVIRRLGFHKAFLIQDHICATFGSGKSCATVVDIGDQKISISCVEDAVSYPQSRIELKYGGGDLTIALWHELQLISFPIQIDLLNPWDLEYLNTIKENYCHLDWNRYDSNRSQPSILTWNKPGQNHHEYQIQFGNELMIVPLSYFNPVLLRASLGKKSVIFYEPQPSVPDDPLDRNYLLETSKKLESKEGEGELADEGQCNVQNYGFKPGQRIPLGIDQAILLSIERCGVTDTNLAHRLSSHIILVGGGCKIDGFTEWLTNKLKIAVPRKRKTVDSEATSYRVFSCVRDSDSATTTWKGAAILTSLETAKELWIDKNEWRTQGSKILREKSLFQF